MKRVLYLFAFAMVQNNGRPKKADKDMIDHCLLWLFPSTLSVLYIKSTDAIDNVMGFGKLLLVTNFSCIHFQSLSEEINDIPIWVCFVYLSVLSV